MKNSTVFHENQNYTIHIPCANATEQHKKHTGSKLASLHFLKSAPHPKFNPNKTSLIHTVNCTYHLYVGRGKRKVFPISGKSYGPLKTMETTPSIHPQIPHQGLWFARHLFKRFLFSLMHTPSERTVEYPLQREDTVCYQSNYK